MASPWIEDFNAKELAAILQDGSLTDAQRLMLNRLDQVNAVRGVSLRTRSLYASIARRLTRFLGQKPLDKAAREDVAAFLQEASRTRNPMGMLILKSMVKNIYTLLTDPEGENVPETVSWIKTKLPKCATKLPKELVRPDEIKSMAQACVHPRDRAVIMVLYDSACRVSELCGLRVGDVEFDQYGGRISVTGKTGSRIVRLINSIPDLQLWLNHHPRRDEPNAPLFVDIEHGDGRKALMQDGVTRLLHRAAKWAGVRKRVYPHGFRHARLTELAKILSESELKIFAGWTASSDMARVYIHLSGQDVDRKLLEKSGLLQQEEAHPDSFLQTKTCARCKAKNSASMEYCAQCLAPIDADKSLQIRLEEERLRTALPHLLRLLQDPDVAKIVARKARTAE